MRRNVLNEPVLHTLVVNKNAQGLIGALILI